MSASTAWRWVRLVLVLIALASGLLGAAYAGQTIWGQGQTDTPFDRAVFALSLVQIIAALGALRWRRVGGAALLAVGGLLLLVGLRVSLAFRARGWMTGAIMEGEWMAYLIVAMFFALWPLLAGAALLVVGTRSAPAQRLSDAS